MNQLFLGFCLFFSTFNGHSSLNTWDQLCSKTAGNTEEIYGRFMNCISSSDDSNTNEFKNILPRIEGQFKSMLKTIKKEGASAKEHFDLLMELIELMDLTEHSSVQNCFSLFCSFVESCDFPVNITYKGTEESAKSIESVASMISALTRNEQLEKNTFLTTLNLKTILGASLTGNADAHEASIAFVKSETNQPIMIQLRKNFKNHLIEANEIFEPSSTELKKDWFQYWVKKGSIERSEPADSQALTLLPGVKRDFRKQNVVNPSYLTLESNRYISKLSYDCTGKIWRQIISVPVVYPDGRIRAVVALSSAFNGYNITQCDEDDRNGTKDTSNPFRNTHKCDRQTTRCVQRQQSGFHLDNYDCKCLKGFFKDKNLSKYRCLPCAPGCRECHDSNPCKSFVPVEFKRVALIINMICVLFCLMLGLLTIYHIKLIVMNTANPKMLVLVLFGAMVAYCEIIPLCMKPSMVSCAISQILQLEGFVLTYGALVLKTWRECKLFYVRSVKTAQSSDHKLLKRLIFMFLLASIFLVIWLSRQTEKPRYEEWLGPDGLRYDTCSITEWNLFSMAMQISIVVWGIVLSIQVRRASIAFKETKLVTWAIFNEGFVSCFIFIFNLLLYTKTIKVSSYALFAVNFVRIHLTITVMLLLLFSYKIYYIVQAKRKPLHFNQSNALVSSPGSKEGEQKSTSCHDETDKERQMRIEIQRLYRQIEEMRSLSMRIANPHLIPKKSRFGYPARKSKVKSKNTAISDSEMSRVISPESEFHSLIVSESQHNIKSGKIAREESKLSTR
nr:G protein-coupled receptor [Proales similis]